MVSQRGKVYFSLNTEFLSICQKLFLELLQDFVYFIHTRSPTQWDSSRSLGNGVGLAIFLALQRSKIRQKIQSDGGRENRTLWNLPFSERQLLYIFPNQRNTERVVKFLLERLRLLLLSKFSQFFPCTTSIKFQCNDTETVGYEYTLKIAPLTISGLNFYAQRIIIKAQSQVV